MRLQAADAAIVLRGAHVKGGTAQGWLEGMHDPCKTRRGVGSWQLELVVVTGVKVAALVDAVQVATAAVFESVAAPRRPRRWRQRAGALLLVEEVRHAQHLNTGDPVIFSADVLPQNGPRSWMIAQLLC